MDTGDSSYAEEVELLRRIADGDEVAFRRLFDRYRDPVFMFAIHFTKGMEVAEEIVQETFLKIWTQREKLPLIKRFEAWLFVIVRNLCYDQLRKLARQTALEQSWGRSESGEAATPTTPDELFEAKEYTGLLDRAIGQLSPQQKIVYGLYREGLLKQEEIAARLGLSLPTVKTHLSLARRSITNYLRENIDLALFIGFIWFP